VKATIDPNRKYVKAIAWCLDHREVLPPKSKFKTMHRDTLYEFMKALGATWDVQSQEWFSDGPANKTTVMTEQSSLFTVRINARLIDLGKRQSEFMELCEALNWLVVRVSNAYTNDDNQSGRVYITLKVND